MWRQREIWRRRHAAILLSFMLGACSTADYQKPIDDFAAATSDANASLAQLNDQVTDAYKAVLDRSVIEGKMFIKMADANCQTTSERCQLIVLANEGDDGEPYPPQPPLTNMTLVMSGIASYAQNLKNLLAADTASQVETQVNAALASVQNLAATVATAEGQPAGSVPAFATPVGAAVNWVVGKYVDHVKEDGLQAATAAAKPVIRQAADLFATTATFVSDVPRSELAEDVSKALDDFRANGNASTLAALASSAARYDQLLVSAPPQLFERLGAAHDALADALQDQDVTPADAIARIEAFATEAQKLAKILKDLKAVGGEG